MARQPTVVLNATLPKTVDAGSGIDWFRTIGGNYAPDLTQSHEPVLGDLECRALASAPQSEPRSGARREVLPRGLSEWAYMVEQSVLLIGPRVVPVGGATGWQEGLKRGRSSSRQEELCKKEKKGEIGKRELERKAGGARATIYA